MITGQHLVNGQWINGPTQWTSQPVFQEGFTIQNADKEIVNQAATGAVDAFHSGAIDEVKTRAKLLRAIAHSIDARADDITRIGHMETGLPEARLIGERGRTTGQLLMFADYIEQGRHTEKSLDSALPDRIPLPRPELQKIMRPLGPVAVFGASNFPLAFSTAGGDTASALAAGCPVVVKGHPAHPATSELVAAAISEAIEQCGIHPGVFALIQDQGIETAQALVKHPGIAAVGFTGSEMAGRSLFDLCHQRPNPIPFYGEMGSLNPVFILPGALKASHHTIAKAWVESLTMGVGQFCTKPGVLVLPQGQAGDEFLAQAQQQLQQINGQPVLTKGIAAHFLKATEQLAAKPGVDTVYQGASSTEAIKPAVYTTNLDTWMQTPELKEEIFGPYAVVVRTADLTESLQLAHSLNGQLTCTLWLNDDDQTAAQSLLPVIEQKAGRLLANGFPTGVEVAESMVHGGPYPASTSVGSTSVGATAIRRFLRPVCYQNLPPYLLPTELKAS